MSDDEKYIITKDNCIYGEDWLYYMNTDIYVETKNVSMDFNITDEACKNKFWCWELYMKPHYDKTFTASYGKLKSFALTYKDGSTKTIDYYSDECVLNEPGRICYKCEDEKSQSYFIDLVVFNKNRYDETKEEEYPEKIRVDFEVNEKYGLNKKYEIGIIFI